MSKFLILYSPECFHKTGKNEGQIVLRDDKVVDWLKYSTKQKFFDFVRNASMRHGTDCLTEIYCDKYDRYDSGRTLQSWLSDFEVSPHVVMSKSKCLIYISRPENIKRWLPPGKNIPHIHDKPLLDWAVSCTPDNKAAEILNLVRSPSVIETQSRFRTKLNLNILEMDELGKITRESHDLDTFCKYSSKQKIVE